MELHPEQELPIEVVIPLSSLETAAKVDNIRLALLWQLGQEASSLAWINERNSSNFCLQP
jgi:hypothetical protein